MLFPSLRSSLSQIFFASAIAFTIQCSGLVAQDFVPFGIDSAASEFTETDWISLPGSKSEEDASSAPRQQTFPANRSTRWFSGTSQAGQNSTEQAQSPSDSWNGQESQSSGNFTLMRSRRPVRTESPGEIENPANANNSVTGELNWQSGQPQNFSGNQLAPIVQEATPIRSYTPSFEAGGFKSLENPSQERSSEAAPSKVHFDQQVTPVAAVNDSGETATSDSNQPLEKLAVPAASTDAGSEAPAEEAPVQTAQAESGVGAETASELTLEEIGRKRSVAESAEVPEDVKPVVLSHYAKATEFLKLSEDAANKAVAYKAEIDAATASIDEQKGKLGKELAPLSLTAGDADLATLEQQLIVEQEMLNTASKSLEDWESRSKVRSERQPQMPVIINQAQEKIAKLKTQIGAAPIPGEHPLVAEARRTEQTAQLRLLEKQLDLYHVEQLRYEALKDLFPLQRDNLVREKKHATKRLEAWKEQISTARRLESEAQAREARRKLQDAHPALRTLAERNATLTETRTQLQDELTSIATDLEQVSEQLESVETDYATAKEKVDRVQNELTTAIGLYLTNQRDHLPNVDRFLAMRKSAAERAAQWQQELMLLEDERGRFGDVVEVARSLAENHEEYGSSTEIEEMALTLAQDRRKYLGDLIGDYNSGLRNLADLDVQAQNLAKLVEEFRSYIDERVLWIKSAPVAEWGTFEHALEGAIKFGSPSQWVNVVTTIVNALVQRPALSTTIIVACILLVLLRWQSLGWLRKITSRADKHELSPMVAMPAALGLTALISIAIPVAILLTSWLIQTFAISNDQFSTALATSLLRAAFYAGTIELLRQLTRRGGVGDFFLGWPDEVTARVYRALTTLMILTTPLVLIDGVAIHFNDGQYVQSLGRVMFVSGMIVLTFVMYQVGAAITSLLSTGNHKRSRMIFRLVNAIILCGPTAFSVLSLMGYHYTAKKLLFRLEMTLLLAAGLVAAFSFAKKWVTAANHRFALASRFHRRHNQAGKKSEVEVENASPELHPHHLSEQIGRFASGLAIVVFLVGAWNIWIEVLPAVQSVSNVELWRTTAQVTEVVDIGEGRSETQLVTRAVPITISKLIFAVIFLAMTFVFSRHLRAVLEVLVFRTFTMDDGAKHAVTTIAGYALTLAGVVTACQTIGVGWSSVQWLLAALTVGLGFGLQEIFANLVSGLILLLERPVRVGDVVTIDSVTGTVSKIHIRATTIVDFDQKEYIVPNKEFITGRMLNWTLSNKTNRLLVPVGVAYGTDTDKARQLMKEVAIAHPVVLDDPAPSVTFDSFGDSALNLTLRCYLPDLKDRLATLTEINRGIDLAFRANDIEIPFPQMDLHLNEEQVLKMPINAEIAGPPAPQLRKAG
ncbi:mechanosensitive ion channel domain-containing protein [Thalassoglobus sp. JC818]|uniref:mechanosensitive ion channel domain-containing protein n=1 Tax=Thalassoglobus sp. JC818 TaxID=3232136 RepID=UPI003459368A